MKGPQNQFEYIPFRGGLNLVTPASQVPPGHLINGLNYEPDINGGYRSFRGYERYDGRPRPSDGLYSPVSCTLSQTPAAGATLTIGAATCRFLKTVTGGMLVFSVSGTVPASTAIFDGITNVGSTNDPAALAFSPEAAEEAQLRVDVSALLRADIASVPGSGPVRGIAQYGGGVYAWRDNAGLTACVMHMASASGWTPVTLAEEVDFTNANVSVEEGDTLTQGAVTATIKRVVVLTGTLLSGTNTGYLVISGRSGGLLAAGAATSTGGGSLTLSGASVAQSFPAGGTYRFDKHNFFGGASTERLYGANGVGRAFEWDGTTLVFLRTGRSDDKPEHVAAWINYLFLAQGASLVNSSVDTPYRWVVAEGAGEKAMGDSITGLGVLQGQALGVACRKSVRAYVGSAPANWTIQTISPEAGAIAGTFAVMGLAHAIDDSGIIAIAPSQTSTAFEYNTVSRLVQPLIDGVRGIITNSCVVRQRNLYRVFCSDGRVISMYADPRRIEFGMLSLPIVVHSVHVDYDASGVERVYVGASDGYVYELDRPSTFDGADRFGGIRVWYTSAKQPRTRKRYRKGVVEMNAELYSAIQVQPDFQFGINEISSAAVETVDTLTTFGAGGIWESNNWDEFFWDAPEIAQPEFQLIGTATNLAVTFYSSNKLDFGHVLQGMYVHYTPRRLQR